MIFSWHFRELQRGEKIRNPIQGEYFSEEAIERPAQALVRESIQNSLDARRDAETVHVRFHVSGPDHALSADASRFWFESAWPHFRATGSGLSVQQPPAPPGCPFITIEDFGTTGLSGDPEAWQPTDSPDENRFFAFFRAEGLSGKEGQRGGRWGVGKTVFPRSSDYNVFFGLTMRDADRRRMLMGQTVLRHHRVGEASYTPDGAFGRREEDGLVMPVEEEDLLRRFCREFRLQRSDEPGLSVVVPFADSEITADRLLDAVAREYFFPIMLGRLTVEVSSGAAASEPVMIDANSIRRVLGALPMQLREELAPLVGMTEWILETSGRAAIRLAPPPADAPPAWSADLLPGTDLARLAADFRAGRRVGVRVPLTVARTRGADASSYFDVYLKKDLDDRGYPPVYIRSGIIIPIRQRRVRGHRLHAMVIIEDAPLASMLGDAETPAHTHFSKDTRNFKGRYRHGKAVIDFVVDAPRRLADFLGADAPARDRRLLADFFPRPPIEESLELEEPEAADEAGENTDGPGRMTGLPARPQPCLIQKRAGGFSLRPDPNRETPPALLVIKLAYDRTIGSPLKKYRIEDFRLQDLSVSVEGASVSWQGDNQLILNRVTNDLRVDVHGFDSHRDLFVQISEGEAGA